MFCLLVPCRICVAPIPVTLWGWQMWALCVTRKGAAPLLRTMDYRRPSLWHTNLVRGTDANILSATNTVRHSHNFVNIYKLHLEHSECKHFDLYLLIYNTDSFFLNVPLLQVMFSTCPTTMPSSVPASTVTTGALT